MSSDHDPEAESHRPTDSEVDAVPDPDPEATDCSNTHPRMAADGYRESLATIRFWRAMRDPTIVHEPSISWSDTIPEDVHKDIRTARLARAMSTPLGERITHGAIPEVIAWCTTASMDARCATNPEFVALYQQAFTDYMIEWQGTDADDLPIDLLYEEVGPPGDKRPGYVDSTGVDHYDELRRWIVEQQDSAFVDIDGGYDDLPFDPAPVPKAHWIRDTSGTTATNPSADTSNASAEADAVNSDSDPRNGTDDEPGTQTGLGDFSVT